MKHILIVVGNEYHLYSAICMYYNYFNTKDYDFKLIITKRPRNNRIIATYDLPFDYFVFPDYLNIQDCKTIKYYPDYEMELTKIFNSVDELYTYFDYSFLITKIIHWVKKNPIAKVYLLQEGVAGYFKYQFPVIKVLKLYLGYLFLFYVKKVKNIDFVYHWGRYKHIDELKMFYPEKVIKQIKVDITKLSIEVNSEINNKIKNVFQYSINTNPKQRYILYLPIGQSRGSANAKQIEYSLIEKLLSIAIYKGFEFIIKTKSGLDSQSYINRFGNRCQIINSKFPVEILISDIYNSLIISAFSSSALHNVNNNTYLWIYPILKFKSNLIPFTPNIKLIRTYPELEKCIV